MDVAGRKRGLDGRWADLFHVFCLKVFVGLLVVWSHAVVVVFDFPGRGVYLDDFKKMKSQPSGSSSLPPNLPPCSTDP